MATYAESVCISPNKTVTSRRNIHYLVIHTMESPEEPQTAENVGRGWFAQKAAGASAHWCLDQNSRVRCVEDKDVAWAAPGANSVGMQYELAGRASQSAADWSDSASLAILDNAAQLCARDAKKFGIPIVHLNKAQILAGQKGFIGHVDATNAFRGGVGHSDPGPNFPWAKFLDMVRKYAGQAATTSTAAVSSDSSAIALGSTGERVKNLQKAFNTKWLVPNKWTQLTTDGNAGPLTINVIKAFQKANGLVVDGVAGAKTIETIKTKWGVVI